MGDKTNPLCQVIIEFDYDVYQQISTYNMMNDEETEGLKIKVYSGSIEAPFLVDSSKLKKEDAKILEEFLRIKLYTHGKAGNYSEMNMTDNDPNNQILPTM